MVLVVYLLFTALALLATYLVKAYLDRWTFRGFGSIPTVAVRLPYVGNALHIDMTKCHRVLSDFARTYGPVFRIRLYKEEILVLNDYKSIHDALIMKGADFAGRPPMYRTKHAERNIHSIVWQTYTDKLLFLRKTVLRSMRMYGSGLEKLEEKCRPDIHEMMERFSATGGEPADPWDIIYDAVCNVMLCLTLGSRVDYDSINFQRIKDMNSLFNDTFGSGRARRLDHIPFLRIFRDDCYCRMQEALKLRDAFWEAELEKLKKSEEDRDCVVQHLFDSLGDVRTMKSQNGSRPTTSGISKTGTTEAPGRDVQPELNVTPTTVKEVFTNLILAGTDTTATALTCFLLVLLHYPDVQDRLWQEINTVVGVNHLTSLADREALPYVEATLLELLRFISHVPLAVPHYTTCDTSVLGKSVPANTTVYINLWALHHDETFWNDPWRFDPTRFLDGHGKLVPPSHENRRRLLPFGAGRRVCLGETLAKNRLFLFATALIQHFHFQAENPDQLPEVDPRTYEMGLVLHPKRFKLRAIRRQKS
ncbi:hypothetical protein BaRGS_00003396 [Batillaria attramentaria]|uniref:Cytochrome P450 n=1 Tax=Batillaria attramentaria TaxID=370345 RepID=A0ABD0LZX2_9CAEN